MDDVRRSDSLREQEVDVKVFMDVRQGKCG